MAAVALNEACEKHFDTPGKSGAHLHRPAICKTALRSNGLFGAIAGKNPSDNRSCTGPRAANDRPRVAEPRAHLTMRVPEEIST
jgi:hypothetical protein